MKTALALLWFATLPAAFLVWTFGLEDAVEEAVRLALIAIFLSGVAILAWSNRSHPLPARVLFVANAVFFTAAALVAGAHAWQHRAVDLTLAGKLEVAGWVALALSVLFPGAAGREASPGARIGYGLATLLLFVALALNAAEKFGLAVPGAAAGELVFILAFIVAAATLSMEGQVRQAKEPRPKPMVLP